RAIADLPPGDAGADAVGRLQGVEAAPGAVLPAPEPAIDVVAAGTILLVADEPAQRHLGPHPDATTEIPLERARVVGHLALDRADDRVGDRSKRASDLPQSVLFEPLICALDIVFPCQVDAHSPRNILGAHISSRRWRPPRTPSRARSRERLPARAARCASPMSAGGARRPGRRARSSPTPRARRTARWPSASAPASRGAAATRRSCAP